MQYPLYLIGKNNHDTTAYLRRLFLEHVLEGKGNSFADCELAWTSFNKNALVFNSRWAGFVKDSREPRVAHPTQKALEVMKWCVREFSREGDSILDPFSGSCTTGVAAKLLNRRFVCIECEREYVTIGRARVACAA